MRRLPRRLALGGALAAAAAGVTLAASPLRWEDLSEADWLYSLATRFADVDGHLVHYPTPTAELVPLLEQRSEPAARRQLAEARLALGDRPGALAAMQGWAEAEGPEAWAEAARWAAGLGEMAFAFRAAARALPGLEPQERAALAGERVAWADAHPEAADPVAMRAERARLLPNDAGAVEDFLRALEKAGRLDEAIAAAEKTTALPPERRLLLRSDLAADHGQSERAFSLLDAAVDDAAAWPIELKRAFAERTAAARPGLAESWRASLEKSFEPKALVRLATLFQGRDRGDQAAELLRQVQRRYEATLDRNGWLLLARLHGEIDSVPDAFRARLAASAGATPSQQEDDLAALARLALRAGSRPLGWGSYNDEPYRWAARVDRTPGFWTGGIALLLTGGDWKQSLAQLESDSLAERTFAAARALVAELARRSPGHAELPALRAALMARHVERGEGREALALLPLVEGGPPAAVAEARRAALLAMRQVDSPLEEEARLWRARLAALAPDDTRPETSRGRRMRQTWGGAGAAAGTAWTRTLPVVPVESYSDVLDEAIARLEQRDPSHRAAVGLIIGELDRLPRAEELWLELADRLGSWNLDDEIGPRYERALERFSDASWWARAARWYARHSRERELDRLAGELADRFRSSAIFERAPTDDRVRLAVPESARAGVRVSLVSWADWVRVKALQRFPHSPVVYREALGRLDKIVDPALLEERGWAVLFADQGRRDAYLADAERRGVLAARLAQWESRTPRTPVDELLVFEGHARLSQFEQAEPAASRLAALYPGDGALAHRVLSLLRSLSALDPSRAASAATLVARTAPAVANASPLWTELGELEHDAGRTADARAAWGHILERAARDPARVQELATLQWDYGETDDALVTIEDARKRLGRPGLLAFEAGVLREEKHDIDGAVREYLQAGLPEESDCYCSAFESDQRSLRRLSQLVGRERVRRALEARIAALQPGVAADEETLVAFYPLTTIRMPDAGLDFTADDWIDRLDHPFDPVAREQRKDARERWREAAREGRTSIAAALLARTHALVAAGTRPAFLDAVERWTRPLVEAQATRADEVTLTAEILVRRVGLAATAEERVTRQIALASYLFAHDRRAEADETWKQLASRVATLPEGAPRMRAEAERALYLERSQGPSAAAAEWERLAARYPWSLGMLEDRLAFLARVGRQAEARAVLEQAAAGAASGQREPLLERLAREALAGGDLVQARRAVVALLADDRIDDSRRLAGAHLLARLALRQDGSADLVAIAREQEPRLRPESRAELFAQLARAAGLEAAWKPSLTLWIEALNRRLDRAWLREACRAAEGAGAADSLLGFFEKQRERSPRDVRWAVALRELRLYFDDVPGALAAARAAIAVRPDRESLWFEAADLLARLGRPREGATLLAEWTKARPASEEAARRRSALLAAAGDAPGALQVERAALEAYAAERPLDDERTGELAARRGRAVRRLLELGLPSQAWALLHAAGAARLAQTDLGPAGEAEVAIAADRFLTLLRQRGADDEFRNALGPLFGERALSEQKEELLGYLADQILPRSPQTTRPGLTLGQAWTLAQQAGLEEPLRVELARRQLAARAGPWSVVPSEGFVDAVAAVVVDESKGTPVLAALPLDRLWARDLVLRDRPDELWTFLGPRWDALAAEVRASSPIAPNARYKDWRSWLDRDTLRSWAAGARRDPARIASIASLMTERRLWDRLWGLGAKQWDVAPLVAILPDDARARWFRMWLVPSPSDPDPAVRARGEALEQATVALGRLVAGHAGSETDPAVQALRGPRDVGAVLDERTRPSRDLWGERPAPPWLVLETLVRLRAGDPEAALVPFELADRSGEKERARLSVLLAEKGGDDRLALELTQEVPSPEATDLARRVRLLQKAGRGDEANAAFRAECRKVQPGLSEAAFRGLVRVAEDLALPDPLTLLDSALPMPGPFVAFVCDTRGLEACQPFRSVSLGDFRTALSARWARRVRPLSSAEARFVLRELWANEASPLPRAGLRRLGGIFAHAAGWLDGVRAGERAEAIAALEALPDDTRLDALLARDAALSPEAWLLRLRVHLLRGEDEKASAMLTKRLAESDAAGLSFAPVQAATPSDELSEENEPAAAGRPDGADGRVYEPVSPLVATLRAALAPFRESGKLALVQDPARAALLRMTAAVPHDVAAWALALDLAGSSAGRQAVLAQIERAWRLGDLDAAALAPIVEEAGRVSPGDADRWLQRLTGGPGIDAALARARLLARLGRKAEAARSLAETRSRGAWSGTDELKAFDLWRALAAQPQVRRPAGGADVAPRAWQAARVFWTRPAGTIADDLALHLRAHPLDLLAARALLRSAAPADPETTFLVERALRQPSRDGGGEADERLLRLRAARAWLPRSPAAARRTLGADEPGLARELERRRLPAAEVRAALADVVRILTWTAPAFGPSAGPAGRAGAEAALAAFEDRDPAGARALRAELRERAPVAAPLPYRVANGRPAPWRPMDLDWTAVQAAVGAEAAIP